MRRALRENLPCAAIALAAAGALAWLSLYGFAWNDYENEAQPAFTALVHGHLVGFLRLAPVYGGSLVLRAPFALLPSLWGGGALAVYRMAALPCLLADRAARRGARGAHARAGRPLLWRAVVARPVRANPIALRAIEVGHAEELLGGALCVFAVLLADRERPVLAGLALGVAIANKEWALLAIGPVLIALPAARTRCSAAAPRRPRRVLLVPIADRTRERFRQRRVRRRVADQRNLPADAAVLVPRPSQRLRARACSAPKSTTSAWRRTWIGRISHPLVIAVAPPLSWLTWRGLRAGRRASAGDGARRGVLTSRCCCSRCCCCCAACSTRGTTSTTRCRSCSRCSPGRPSPVARPPWLALGVVLVWTNAWLSLHTSADVQAAFFLALVAPARSDPRPAAVRARASAGARPSRLASSRRRRSGDDREALLQPVEHLVTVLAHGQQVLDPHA